MADDIQPTAADTAGPADSVQPAPRSVSGSWYDGPRGSDATSANPGADDSAPAPGGAEPDADDRGGGEPTDKGGDKKDGEQSNLLMDGVKAKDALKRVYADFKAEGIELDKGGKGAIDAVTKLLDQAMDASRTGGELNHQSLRDSIVKHGVDAIKGAHEAAAKNQRDVWNKLNDDWKSQSRKEFGPKLDRTLMAAKSVIEEYGGSPAQQKELLAHLNNNGMGNFPGFIRLLANIGNKTSQYEDFSVGGRAQTTPQRGNASPGSGRMNWYKGDSA